jgi:hypothetical protein
VLAPRDARPDPDKSMAIEFIERFGSCVGTGCAGDHRHTHSRLAHHFESGPLPEQRTGTDLVDVLPLRHISPAVA